MEKKTAARTKTEEELRGEIKEYKIKDGDSTTHAPSLTTNIIDFHLRKRESKTSEF